MPSRKRLRKKALSKNEVDNVAGAMQNLRDTLTPELDEQRVNSMFHAARNGSEAHVSKVGLYMMIMPEAHIAEAVSIMCSVLDVPAFPPERPLPASLVAIRPLAYKSLQSLSQIPDNYNFDESSSLQPVLVRNWPMICNWMQYFFFEFARSQNPQPSNSTISLLSGILTVAPGIINNISRCGEVYGRLTLKNDDMLNMLVKAWLNLNLSPTDPLFSTTFHRCYSLLSASLMILDQNDSGMRLATVAKFVYHEAGGDTSMVTKKLLRHIKDPLKACKQWEELSVSSLEVILYLTEDKLRDDYAAKFMNSSLENDLVPLLAKLLTFVAEQLTGDPKRRILSTVSAAEMMRAAFRLVLRSCCSRNGQHWAALFFDLGFLRALAKILSSDHVIDEFIIEVLTVLFGTCLPGYLCHRFVLRSAIKAVKEISASGGVKKLEVRFLHDSWAAFTNILLERTVINAVFNRYYPDADVRKCENCSVLKQEASLFRCAGCMSVMYCSEECQATSWETHDHRTECKRKQKARLLSGMAMPKSELAFLNVVALAELRRHLPGVCKQLATFSNPLGILLEDAFFSVSFLSCPSTITVRPGGQARSRNMTRDEGDEGEAEDATTHPFAHMQPKWLEVCSFWGGRNRVSITQSIPPNTELFSALYKYAGDDTIKDAHLLHRKPAQGEDGKDLRFVLDDVDRHVMHARRHFRPPAPGDKEAPKTIYDYIEARVADEPSTMSWLVQNNQAAADLLSQEEMFRFFLRNVGLLSSILL